MARTAPGEARAKTSKARKATGNPRKVKESADLVTSTPEAFPEDALDELSEEGRVEEVADEESADAEELGTRPDPNIKTEGQIKRAAKAVKKVEQQRRRKIVRRIIFAFILLILAGLVALCVLFAQHRWFTYDDTADFIGTWYVEDTDLPIVITEDKIELTDGVAYTYRIDPETKTITFKFGNMTGQGRYRFSLDRQQLSIMDGEYEYWDTLLDDAAWTLQAVMRDLRGLSMLNPSLEATFISKGTLTLLRQPNSEATALPEGADVNDESALLNDAEGDEGEPDDADDAASNPSSPSDDAPSGMGFTQLDVNDL